MRLDIESLRAFKTVAESGGVTRAASRLNLTQSAVSHKLRRLEDKIGCALFRRSNGGFGPTDDGQRLLRYAERLLVIHDEAVADFEGRDLSGELRLGITEDTTGAGIAKILARFARLYPDIAIAARVEQSLTLLDWLARGEIDLAVAQVFEKDVLPGDRILWCDDLVWAQSEDFALPPRDRLPFISFDARCFYRLWAKQALAAAGKAMDIVLECPSTAGVRSAVRSGLGVAILNRRNLGAGLTVSDLPLPSLPRIAYVARSTQAPPSPAAAALLAAIEREFS